MLVHQTLHGYARGHRLLAASLDLPSRTLQSLAELTDASDSGTDKTFPSLLAVFPLPEVNLVAMAMSWPAPEAGRPGAVVTHTLLMGAQIPLDVSSTSILSSFRRPDPELLDSSTSSQPESRLTPYELPLEVTAQSPRYTSLPREWLAVLFWAIYDLPVRPLAIRADQIDSVVRQHALLEVVLQQWPSLRGSFAIAEAPHWRRDIDGQPFDVHLTTGEGLAGLGDSGTRSVRDSDDLRAPDWAHLVAQDSAKGTHDFSRFLSVIGDEFGIDRGAYGSVAETWIAEKRDDPATALSVVDRQFPRRREAVNLKRGLFGAPPERFEKFFPDEVRLVGVLASAPASRCLSVPDMALDIRGAAIAKNDERVADQLVREVVRGGVTDLGRSLLTGIVPTLTSLQLARLLRFDPDVFVAVLKVDPDAGRRVSYEQVEPPSIEAFAQYLRDEADPETLVFALHTIATFAPRSWAQALAPVLQKQIGQAPAEVIADENDFAFWSEAVPSQVLVAAAGAGVATLGKALELARLIPPSQTSLVPVAYWEKLADVQTSSVDDRLSFRALANLFLLTSDNPSPNAAAVATAAFSQLRSAAVAQTIPDGIDRDSLAAALEDAQPWDIARGITARLAHRYRRFDSWNPRGALSADSDSFRALLELDIRQGREDALAIRLATEADLEGITDEQFIALQEVLGSHAKKSDLLSLVTSMVRRAAKLPF